jgi:hypothetical protein
LHDRSSLYKTNIGHVVGRALGNLGNLKVGRWAAIVVAGTHEFYGCPAEEDEVPSALRRRMGRLERLAARCTLGVLKDDVPTDELVFASRFGNLETLCTLLTSLSVREPMSPMAFSGSVHNATPGLVGQIRKQKLSHTAISAGARSLEAGLIECHARLASGECDDVTLTFADLALPGAYRPFEEEENAAGVALAVRLALAERPEAAMAAKPGRSGALDIIAGLKDGLLQFGLDESRWLEAVP